ncbi:putative signal transducing protein [Pseudoalteromonas sp. T1lg65]|uniref:putative signal transducing protein n=1 Tax=Pseudoalteromonas sp. T1lg65 TaxID=2077101 RepID=UPI003F7B0E71
MKEKLFNWVLLFQAENPLEAHLVKGLLEREKIAVRLQGEALQGALGEIPFEQAAISIMVYAIKLPEAKQILVNYQQMKHQSQYCNDWYCDQCGEANGPAFEVCWQCGTRHE